MYSVFTLGLTVQSLTQGWAFGAILSPWHGSQRLRDFQIFLVLPIHMKPSMMSLSWSHPTMLSSYLSYQPGSLPSQLPPPQPKKSVTKAGSAWKSPCFLQSPAVMAEPLCTSPQEARGPTPCCSALSQDFYLAASLAYDYHPPPRGPPTQPPRRLCSCAIRGKLTSLGLGGSFSLYDRQHLPRGWGCA